jgi:pyruvate/oxaloacetate carboxyltransferase
METLIQYITDHMAAVTWLDFVDTAILIGMGAYGLYRIESKVNPLVDQVNALTRSNKYALEIIDEQDADLKEVRKKYQALHDKHLLRVTPDPDAVWHEWPLNN